MTMKRAVGEFERASNRMASDFKSIITDSEDLLKATATVSGAGFESARSQFEEKLKRARVALAQASQPMIDGVGKTAAVADDYVHGSPWTAIGAALATGTLIGLLIARR